MKKALLDGGASFDGTTQDYNRWEEMLNGDVNNMNNRRLKISFWVTTKMNYYLQ